MAFEDFVTAELPVRPTLLQWDASNVAYDGDPNDGAAADILKNSPKGNLYLRGNSNLYQKKSTGSDTWESLNLPTVLSADVILAVETTGNDADPARPQIIDSGDWSANPFETIQAAAEAIPRHASSSGYDATINVGVGNFAGFVLNGYGCTVVVQGTNEAATLTTGPNSGTATGGASTTLTLTGAGWTVDDLRNKFLTVTGGPGAGKSFVITGNTADTVTIIGSGSMGIGSEFTIESIATKIVSLPVGGSRDITLNGMAKVTLSNFEASVSGIGLTANFFAHVHHCTLSGSWGLSGGGGNSVFIQYCNAIGSTVCAQFQGTAIVSIYSCFADGCSEGFNSWQANSYFSCGYIHARNCGVGSYIVDSPWSKFSVYIFEGCGTGLSLDNSTMELVNGSFNGCTSKAMSLKNTFLSVATALTDTGNTGWGILVKGLGNLVSLAVNPTISGTLGEVSVDGSTDFTWAALANTDDYAVDTVTGARIYRE